MMPIDLSVFIQPNIISRSIIVACGEVIVSLKPVLWNLSHLGQTDIRKDEQDKVIQ